MIDSGSTYNLCGDEWAETIAGAAPRHGRHSTHEERRTFLKFTGVGHDSQPVTHDCALPISLSVAKNQGVSSGTNTAPVIANSDLSILLGLESLRENEAVIDFGTQAQYLAGSGEHNLHPVLWPDFSGSQCDLTPSDHLVLPCRDYSNSMVAPAVEQKTVSESKPTPGECSAGVPQSRAEAVPNVLPTNANDFQ